MCFHKEKNKPLPPGVVHSHLPLGGGMLHLWPSPRQAWLKTQKRALPPPPCLKRSNTTHVEEAPDRNLHFFFVCTKAFVSNKPGGENSLTETNLDMTMCRLTMTGNNYCGEKGAGFKSIFLTSTIRFHIKLWKLGQIRNYISNLVPFRAWAK